MEQTIKSNGLPLTEYPDFSIGSAIKRVPSKHLPEIETVEMSLDPTKTAYFLGAIAGLLVLTNIAVLAADSYTGYSSVFIHKLVKLFNLDLEVNVPTFFSVLILFVASVLLGTVTKVIHNQKGSHVFEWSVLTLGFLFMAFDEMASVHERLIEPMRSMLGVEALGMLYYAWVVPALGLVAFLGFGFLRFLINLPGRTRWAFLTAGAMYLAGAIGCELFEGMVGEGNLAYNTLVAVEESLEMGGIIVFIWALLRYIADCSRSGGVKFDLAPTTVSQEKNWSVSELGLQS